MDLADELLRDCLRDIEESRVYHGSKLASAEETYARAENAVFSAYELTAFDDVSAANARWAHAFKGLAEIRACLNRLHEEIGKPAPDWDLFYEDVEVV